ncbi:MAG TPA: cellulase family glycosylhydrolase, partial [Microlunatus sp.]|nr:cellulase family glycosylhydrolase [Microlunatus sp.]
MSRCLCPLDGRVLDRRVPRRLGHLLAILALVGVGVLGVGVLGVAAVGLTASPAAAAPASVGWLHTEGARIVDRAGRPYVVTAVNWFGMETPSCAPHGLWQIGLDEGLAQIAGFGYNTIRLPFSNECLAGTLTSDIDATKNPTLVGKTPLQVMDAVVARARAHGLRVILDRHRPDSGSQSELWYTNAWSEQRWITDWQSLARRYATDSTVIGMDLHNEPHGRACWDCGDVSRDWAAAATRAGNAVLAVNPDLLILVEGVEQQSSGNTWWGGGLADAKIHPIRLDVAGRLVYSPHDYPSSIYAQSWFSDPRYPANLDAVWTANWGYLQRDGIAPVLLGEFGTRLQGASDRAWLQRLVGYLQTHQMSFAYWSFNPNSGDTGGLVADDWVTPQRAKLEALAPILGGGTAPAPSTPTSGGPAPTSPAPTSPAPTSPAPTSPAPTGPAGLRASWQLNS